MRTLMLALALLVAAPPPAAHAEQAAPAALPEEIPLFPLPQVVLFPRVTRPLLIFEARYRDMVADALKGDGIIGAILLRPGFEREYDGRPPVYDIGCAGEIVEYEQLPDGRYAILLRGVTAFRIVRERPGKTYRLARVEPVPAQLPAADAGPLKAARERLGRAIYAAGQDTPDESLEDADFVDVAAQTLRMPEETRQALLEQPRVLARATALLDYLER